MAISKEDALRQLRRSTVTLDYGAISWDKYKSASYEFNFSELTWSREMVNIYHLKSKGEIPTAIADKFLEKIWFVVGLPRDVDYWSESERVVPATVEEKVFLESDTKRLAQFRAQIDGIQFRWLPEVDTSAPYCKLTAAFSEFLAALDI